MQFPAARILDMHTCPMCMGVPAPIVYKCAWTVLTGMMPQARVTDLCVCVGPPPPMGGDPIITGAWTVLVENLPAARMTDLTLKGGAIVTGFPTVLIGTQGGGGAGGGGGGAGMGAPSSLTPKQIADLKRKALMNKIKNGQSSIKIEGSDAFKEKALAALDRLAQSPTGMKLLQALDSSDKTTTIKQAPAGKGNTETAADWNKGLYDTTNNKPGPGSDSTVLFNPDRDKLNGEDWMTRDPAIGLGHELIHSYHDANGTTDGRSEVEYTDADGNKRKAPGYELQTVGLGEYKDSELTENNIRKDFDEHEIGKNDEEHQRPRY
ncbi:M91 family zinc metallopeptidase [Labrenzia sp. VG12]|uniref:M91 family zinc metallopeptidase n=1 Tax=Labrenzia sp. VG12 TaxID=2021862 RepID=UPI0012FDEA97|nr:M91 family zinc metallopeptidase [Labrenzia sp. VG12]